MLPFFEINEFTVAPLYPIAQTIRSDGDYDQNVIPASTDCNKNDQKVLLTEENKINSIE
jgi:hypothetical protein